MFPTKRIEFNVYLNNFYDLIRVNTPNNQQTQTHSTPIFYKIINDEINISFIFSNFYIETFCNLDILRIKYEEEYNNDNMIFDDSIRLNFMEWVNNKFMDERGIKEL